MWYMLDIWWSLKPVCLTKGCQASDDDDDIIVETDTQLYGLKNEAVNIQGELISLSEVRSIRADVIIMESTNCLFYKDHETHYHKQ